MPFWNVQFFFVNTAIPDTHDGPILVAIYMVV